MIFNYFKTAFRSIKKQKGHFFLNLVGLAVGMVSCLLILLYVQDEISFDRFNTNYDEIYRIQASVIYGGNDGENAQVGAPAGPALVRDYPEVKAAVRLWQSGSFLVRHENGSFEASSFNEQGGGFADPSIFEIFSIPLVSGEQGRVLQNPYTMVLSESMAKKYFGDENPIGKTLLLDNKRQYEIQGVYADFPDNSHFAYDFLLSFSSIDGIDNAVWLNFNYFTYVLLEKNVDITALNEKLLNVARLYCGPEFQQFMGVGYDDVMSQGNKLEYYLEPLGRIHLHTDVQSDIQPQGDIRYVAILSIIAIFILVIACFNFINLTTALSGKRAKEVALRKVVGAPRVQVMMQFLTEAFVICATSLVAALVLAVIALPYFNVLAGKDLEPVAFLNPGIGGILFGMLLVTSLGAGLYPAFYLSSFKPVAILNDKLHITGKGKTVRSVLVVFQFSLSIILLISTIVVSRQLHYIQNKELGFEKERVLLIHDAYIMRDNLQAFKQNCLSLTGVQTASISSYLPVPSVRNDNALYPESESEALPVSMQTWNVDDDYLETMGIQLIAGRNFQANAGTNSLNILVNEAAIRKFGWDDPIGKTVRRNTSSNPPEWTDFTVVGIIKDFHFESLKEEIGPIALFNRPSSAYLSIRLNTDQLPNLISRLEKLWKDLAPGQPFAYSFMEDRFNRVYKTEQNISRLFTIAAGIAMVIGCLGLFGLAAFTAEQKTKEIGIRKVLGATSSNIVFNMTKTFTRWVVVANLISFPVAWYFMRQWLNGFAYRGDLEWWIFLGAGLSALLIAQLTVGFQAVRAALANPAKSLKYE